MFVVWIIDICQLLRRPSFFQQVFLNEIFYRDAGVCLSVYLSVTSRRFVETDERIKLVLTQTICGLSSYPILHYKGILMSKNKGNSPWNFVHNSELCRFFSGIFFATAGRSVCLPLLIFPCIIKSRSSLVAPTHPSGPGKGP